VLLPRFQSPVAAVKVEDPTTAVEDNENADVETLINYVPCDSIIYVVDVSQNLPIDITCTDDSDDDDDDDSVADRDYLPSHVTDVGGVAQ